MKADVRACLLQFESVPAEIYFDVDTNRYRIILIARWLEAPLLHRRDRIFVQSNTKWPGKSDQMNSLVGSNYDPKHYCSLEFRSFSYRVVIGIGSEHPSWRFNALAVGIVLNTGNLLQYGGIVPGPFVAVDVCGRVC